MLRTLMSLCAILQCAWSQSPPLQPAEVTYDGVYDLSDFPVANVSCSTLPYLSNYSKISDIPNWPNVGGGFMVTDFGIKSCATCWSLTYNRTGIDVAVLLIDSASSGFPGFDIAKSTMNTLTNGKAEELGVIYVDVEELPLFECGIDKFQF